MSVATSAASAAPFDREWASLLSPVRVGTDRLQPSDLGALPEPARRWLTRVVPPGSATGGAVLLEMEGQLRLGRRWFGFRADQLLRPGVGFVWRPVVGGRILRFTGADVLIGSDARTEFRLHGRLPVATAAGDDVVRSATGRLAAETVVWAPHLLVALADAWDEVDENRAVVVVPTVGESVAVEIDVDRSGGLRGLRLDRWNGSAATPSFEPFGGRVTSELITGAGVRVAGSGSVGWGWGTPSWPDGEFFRYRLQRCVQIP